MQKSNGQAVSHFVPASQKRGQLTLFIILGIIILVGVLVYVFVFSKYSLIGKFGEDISDPEAYIKSCLDPKAKKTIDQFLENNLNPEPTDTNYFRYNEDGEAVENVPYACKVGEFYSPCINQIPNLQGKLKKDLEEEIQSSLDECWGKLTNEYERRGYTVQEQKINLEILSRQNNLEIKIPNTLSLTSSEGTDTYSEFDLQINSKIFQLAALATKITNFESTLCEFDATGWMMAYPDINIERFRAGDQTKVYTLRSRYTGEEIKFAIRTCIIPAGI